MLNSGRGQSCSSAASSVTSWARMWRSSGARVHGDALRTGLQAQLCGARDAGNAQVARVAHQGDLVDVDRQGGGITGERWS